MEQSTYRFIDRSGMPEPNVEPGLPVVIPKEAIETEVERLASLPPPANGRRMSIVCNPASGVGNGLAAGTAVTLSVLKPRERTKPIRHNSSQVNFCIRGAGHSIVGGKRIEFSQYDVWNTPPWTVYHHANETSDLQVRLTYSNSALLEKLNIHVVDEDPPAQADMEPGSGQHEPPKTQHPFGTFQLTPDGAYLMPYEQLINPDVAPSAALHWPWKLVKQELDKLTALGKSYVGRRLYLMYNPATGRTNGTTNNFFATLCVRPATINDKPHRHTAAAINYFFTGRGYSVVGGKRFEWKAGDLMLTAPGWAVHGHNSYDENVYELTIQDSPLNIWMGSLLWQEDLAQPMEALGATGGFATNRETIKA